MQAIRFQPESTNLNIIVANCVVTLVSELRSKRCQSEELRLQLIVGEWMPKPIVNVICSHAR